MHWENWLKKNEFSFKPGIEEEFAHIGLIRIIHIIYKIVNHDRYGYGNSYIIISS